MFYSGGELSVYQSNEYVKYTIGSGSIYPTPSDDAIENIYFNKTGANSGVYKYDVVNGWVKTNIGGEGTTEKFTFINNDGQVVESISAS